MDNITVIDLNDYEKWDNIVKSFNTYDVHYMSNFVKAFQKRGDGQPRLIYYNDGKTKAINVLLIRDIAKCDLFMGKLPENEYFDISTPYGYGGFWFEGDGHKDVLDAYDKYCNQKGFVSEFVRFHLMSGYERHYRGTVESRSHNVIRDLQPSIEEIHMDFEHKVRKNLKRAAQYELSAEIDSEGTSLDTFLSIYYGTMKRTDAKEEFFFSKDFFDTINTMDGNFVYFTVYYGDVPISTELVIYGKEICYSFLGGTAEEYFNMRPNDFLKNEIVKWSKEKGLKYFVLGGGYGSDDGIFRYKKSFAPNGVKEFFVGHRILCQERYEELLKIRISCEGIEEGNKFFPIYRTPLIHH